MFQTLDQMIAAQATPVVRRTWAAIPDFLEAEVAAGKSRSSAKKASNAAAALLESRGLAAENTPLDLAWFDRIFPAGGWDPIDMPFAQSTYESHRHRVRPLIARMLGAATSNASVAPRDSWDDVAEFLAGLERFAEPGQAKKLIPVTSTLTNVARRGGIETAGVDQPTLVDFHANALKGERGSLRGASRLLADLQSTVPAILQWFPHPIQPIRADGSFRYNVPEHYRPEVEEFVEKAARKRYIRAKKRHEYVRPKTRISMRTAVHAAIDALIATGHLLARANGFAGALEKPEALEDLAGHMARRVETGEIAARHATGLVGRLPVILERNGIDPAPLREAIAEIDDLRQYPDKAGMPAKTKKFCRKLIESRRYRNRFLLAHAGPRQVAQTVLDTAQAEGRKLAPAERKTIIRHGVVALFCAIEIGGAPVRVENVLEMPYGGENAWIRPKDKTFAVVIPGGHVKNGSEIRFDMAPGKHRFAETVRWYLDHVRPLILEHGDGQDALTPKPGATRASRWLIPMLSDIDRPCPYETFHDWFTKIMRDVVGVPCTPHNYRHGQASLLYHRHPGRIGWIAQRLGDTEGTVLKHYAWVHAELAMAAGQRLICDLIDD